MVQNSHHQCYDAHDEGALSKVSAATEEAGHSTAHRAPWIKRKGWFVLAGLNKCLLDHFQTRRLQTVDRTVCTRLDSLPVVVAARKDVAAGRWTVNHWKLRCTIFLLAFAVLPLAVGVNGI